MNTSHSGGETDRPDSLGDSLVLRVNRPRPDVVLVLASGTVDESTAARFERLLFDRIEDAVRTVLLDLTGVGFLAVSALHLLARAGNAPASGAWNSPWWPPGTMCCARCT